MLKIIILNNLYINLILSIIIKDNNIKSLIILYNISSPLINISNFLEIISLILSNFLNIINIGFKILISFSIKKSNKLSISKGKFLIISLYAISPFILILIISL